MNTEHILLQHLYTTRSCIVKHGAFTCLLSYILADYLTEQFYKHLCELHIICINYLFHSYEFGSGAFRTLHHRLPPLAARNSSSCPIPRLPPKKVYALQPIRTDKVTQESEKSCFTRNTSMDTDVSEEPGRTRLQVD